MKAPQTVRRITGVTALFREVRLLVKALEEFAATPGAVIGLMGLISLILAFYVLVQTL